MAMKYSLYQNGFDRLTYILALLEEDKKQVAYKAMMGYLKEDRGDFFDSKEFWKKVQNHRKEIQAITGGVTGTDGDQDTGIETPEYEG